MNRTCSHMMDANNNGVSCTYNSAVHMLNFPLLYMTDRNATKRAHETERERERAQVTLNFDNIGP